MNYDDQDCVYHVGLVDITYKVVYRTLQYIVVFIHYYDYNNSDCIMRMCDE